MCTASGRKAAQSGLTAQRRDVGRMVDKSKFIGGKAGLYKTVSIAGSTKQSLYNQASASRAREESRLGAEAGSGSSYVDPRSYGGRSVSMGGAENDWTEARFSGTASKGVSGMTWTGASGRQYKINRTENIQYGSGESGGEIIDRSATYSVGAANRVGVDIEASPNTKGDPLKKMGFRQRIAWTKNTSAADKEAHYKKYQNYNVGANKRGIDIGKTEDEARAIYKDFGKDFDKDEYRGAFYKTYRGLANQQRQNTEGQEQALRKIHRIRNNGGPDTTGGNTRRKQKKQGNLRINTGGLQGGSTGGGTTLS